MDYYPHGYASKSPFDLNHEHSLTVYPAFLSFPEAPNLGGCETKFILCPNYTLLAHLSFHMSLLFVCLIFYFKPSSWYLYPFSASWSFNKEIILSFRMEKQAHSAFWELPLGHTIAHAVGNWLLKYICLKWYIGVCKSTFSKTKKLSITLDLIFRFFLSIPASHPTLGRLPQWKCFLYASTPHFHEIN